MTISLEGWLAIIVGLVGTAAFGYYFYIKPKHDKLKKEIRFDGKTGEDITPEDFMGIRGTEKHGYNPFYLQRDFDQQLLAAIEKGEHIIVIGPALAGKTRAVFEAIRKMNPTPNVIMPRLDASSYENIEIPSDLQMQRKTVVIFDDLDKFTEKSNIFTLMEETHRQGATLIATCRSGQPFKFLCEKMEKLLPIFSKPIEIGPATQEEGRQVAQETGKKFPAGYNGIIGIILVALDEMQQRYHRCGEEEKLILKAMKRLYSAGVYREREIFSLAHIRSVFAAEGMNTNDSAWKSMVDGLARNAFFDLLENNELRTEETYLQQIIPGNFTSPAELKKTADIFPDDFDALIKIANRAYELGDISLEKAALKKFAADIYQACLPLRPVEKYPEDYAMTQNNLGVAYSTLAEVEDKADNCRDAIAAYTEALKVYTLDRFPIDYAMTQNNLGAAYRTLAEVDDTAANCRAAIAAYTEALKVRTLDRFPMQYANTQNNLGVAYSTLAEVDDKANNCRNAIDAFTEALKVRTIDRFPMDYAMTQNNLGNAYCTLAEVDDKAANCRAAIAASTEALKVYTLDRFPMDYAMTQNNLGTALQTLAEVEDKAANCRNAIDAFTEALKVRTIDRFPMDYAMTQNNLGAAYRTLAEVDDKAANCRAAIAASTEALKVYTLDRFPIDYAMTQNNLGTALQTLAEVEDKAANCRAAIAASTEALKVYTLDRFPMQYAMTQYNLALLYITMASESDKQGNCQKARQALHEALKVYTPENLPQYNAYVMNALAYLDEFCKQE